MGLIKDLHGNYAESPQVALSCLMDTHFPGSIEPRDEIKDTERLTVEQEDILEFQNFITEQKVDQRLIKHFRASNLLRHQVLMVVDQFS